MECFACGDEMPDHPSCGNCASYQLRHLDPAAQAKADAAGHPVSEGFCIRYPQMLPKRSHECCGEHSELAKNRMRYQAELIAQEMGKVVLPPALGEDGRPLKPGALVYREKP